MKSFFYHCTMNDKIIITIDGHSSCGKSSLAKDLSSKIGYRYLDSGAMYRAVTLYCLKNRIDINEPHKVSDILTDISIDFRLVNGENHCFLNNIDEEKEIRTMAVANNVSQIATISSVRRFLVGQQRIMGSEKAIVMDGRDIGTVVFPDAELKIFLTADSHIRTLRRYEELINKNMEVTLEEVEINLQKRDHIDSTRIDSPLLIAEDAIILNNSNITRTEQLNLVVEMYNNVISNG